MERVIVNNVSKRFKIGFKKNQTALSRFVSIFSGREPKKSFWVLKDISFRAKAGEIIGIIGKNGSGKSTLLRVIAGIYDKEEGTIEINGNVISLIGLSIGLKERLTMKDNIYLCCSLFGLRQKDIKKRFDSIVRFTELEDFVNTKLYQFSDGMRQRLAFSIAIHCDPEILLLDEVFAVGDENFKHKSTNKIKELVKNGATVLLVTHHLEMLVYIEKQIGKHCDRVILMDKGEVVKYGDTKSIIEKYVKNYNL